MSDETTSEANMNKGTLDKKHNISDKQSVLAERTLTENNVDDDMTWSIVHFETDEEEGFEGFMDLIPSSWITTTERLCWYPMNEHQSTVQKLIKQYATPDLHWDCYNIRKIEANIRKYDQGRKMLVKLLKDPNATLYSDMEEKGKGKRIKKPMKHFDDVEKENNPNNRKNVHIPPLPQLSAKKTSQRSSQSLSHKVDKAVKKSSVDEASSSNNNVQKPMLKLIKDSPCFTEIHTSQSASQASEEICCFQEVSLSGATCTCLKNQQKCACGSTENVTLRSLADSIRHLNEHISCKY